MNKEIDKYNINVHPHLDEWHSEALKVVIRPSTIDLITTFFNTLSSGIHENAKLNEKQLRFLAFLVTPKRLKKMQLMNPLEVCNWVNTTSIMNTLNK